MLFKVCRLFFWMGVSELPTNSITVRYALHYNVDCKLSFGDEQAVNREGPGRGGWIEGLGERERRRGSVTRMPD